LLDRGFKDTILLIPGWAADYRIFGTLKLDFNYLVPSGISLDRFTARCIGAMDEYGLETVSVLGWSMGAFLALDLAADFPDRTGPSITMVSARPRYDPDVISGIRVYMKANRAGYLYRFYNECFSEEEEDARHWFRLNLMRPYLKGLDAALLDEGLEYLSGAHIEQDRLKGLGVRFIHGKNDKIAPVDEVTAMKASSPLSKLLIIDGAGHMPFLNKNFTEVFNG
jgi:pimeloyl-ACP methyl ester carboxylesterase